MDWDWEGTPPRDTPGGAPRDERPQPSEEPPGADTAAPSFFEAVDRFEEPSGPGGPARAADEPEYGDEPTQIIRRAPELAAPPLERGASRPDARRQPPVARTNRPDERERPSAGDAGAPDARYLASAGDVPHGDERLPRAPVDRAAARARRRKQIRRRRLVALAAAVIIVILLVVLIVRGCGAPAPGQASAGPSPALVRLRSPAVATVVWRLPAVAERR